jgi:hypothetical protein
MLFKSLILPLSYFKKSWLFGVSLGLVLILFAFKLSAAHADNLSINTPGDCNANSVIWCGVNSVNDLVKDYNNGGHFTAKSIQDIYSFYGITSSDIQAINSGSLSVESGTVNTSGDVMDNQGNKVATGAITGGREESIKPGSTQENVNGTIFFERAPSVSFQEPSLSAYVFMDNGKFDFAVLASCGNPVKATPVVTATQPKTTTPVQTPAPTPTPAPTQTPTTAPVSVCSGNISNSNTAVASQGGNCSTNTTVVQTTITPTATTETPAATGICSSLDVVVDPSNALAVTATANSASTNGAILESATFNFGDGTITPASTDTAASHTIQLTAKLSPHLSVRLT